MVFTGSSAYIIMIRDDTQPEDASTLPQRVVAHSPGARFIPERRVREGETVEMRPSDRENDRREEVKETHCVGKCRREKGGRPNRKKKKQRRDAC